MDTLEYARIVIAPKLMHGVSRIRIVFESIYGAMTKVTNARNESWHGIGAQKAGHSIGDIKPVQSTKHGASNMSAVRQLLLIVKRINLEQIGKYAPINLQNVCTNVDPIENGNAPNFELLKGNWITR